MLLGLYVRVRSFWGNVRERSTDESGAIATEYVLLLALIAIVIVAGATILAQAINEKFSDACDAINASSC